MKALVAGVSAAAAPGTEQPGRALQKARLTDVGSVFQAAAGEAGGREGLARPTTSGPAGHHRCHQQPRATLSATGGPTTASGGPINSHGSHCQPRVPPALWPGATENPK